MTGVAPSTVLVPFSCDGVTTESPELVGASV